MQRGLDNSSRRLNLDKLVDPEVLGGVKSIGCLLDDVIISRR